jgi:hypothetical protein
VSVPLAVEASDSVYAFALPLADPDSFAGPEGVGLDPSLIAQLRATTGAELGACGARCFSAPSDRPELLGVPGQSCPIPSWIDGVQLQASSTSNDATELAMIREKVRLVSPGACPCHPIDAVSAHVRNQGLGATLSLLEPGEGGPPERGYPPRAFVLGSSGSVALFGDARASLITARPTQRTDLAIPPALLHGPIVSAGPLPDGSYAVFSFTNTDLSKIGAGTDFTLFDRTFSAPPRFTPEVIYKPNQVVMFPGDPKNTYLIGGIGSRSGPAIVACTGAADIASGLCQPILSSAVDSNPAAVFLAAVRTASGPDAPFFAPTSGNLLALIAKSCSQGQGFGAAVLRAHMGLLSVACRTDPTQCPSGVPLVPGPVNAIGALGPRVFMASAETVGPSQRFVVTVLSRDFSEAIQSCPDVSQGWEMVGSRDPLATCRSLSTIGPDQIRLECDDGLSMDFDGAGNQIRPLSPANEPGLSRVVVRQQWAPGFRVALTSDRRVERLDQSSSSAFETIYGSAADRDRWEGPVVSRKDGFWVFGRHALVSHVTLDTNGQELAATTSTLPGVDAANCHATAAAVNHADDSIIVALSSSVAPCAPSSPTGPWLYRFDSDGSGRLIGSPPHPSIAILGMAETSSGSFALFSDTGEIFRLEAGGSLVQIADQDIDWVDLPSDAAPNVASEEQHPRVLSDRRFEVFGTLRGALRAASGANGVGFIVGEEHIILRVVGRRARRFSFSRVLDPATPAPSESKAYSTALRALCADDVLFAVGDSHDDYDHDDVYQLISTPAGDLGLRAFNPNSRVSPMRAGYPLGIVSRLLGDERGLLLLYGQDGTAAGNLSQVLSLDSGRVFFPLDFVDGAVDERGIFLLTAAQGRLLSATPSP